MNTRSSSRKASWESRQRNRQEAKDKTMPVNTNNTNMAETTGEEPLIPSSQSVPSTSLNNATSRETTSTSALVVPNTSLDNSMSLETTTTTASPVATLDYTMPTDANVSASQQTPLPDAATVTPSQQNLLPAAITVTASQQNLLPAAITVTASQQTPLPDTTVTASQQTLLPDTTVTAPQSTMSAQMMTSHQLATEAWVTKQTNNWDTLSDSQQLQLEINTRCRSGRPNSSYPTLKDNMIEAEQLQHHNFSGCGRTSCDTTPSHNGDSSIAT